MVNRIAPSPLYRGKGLGVRGSSYTLLKTPRVLSAQSVSSAPQSEDQATANNCECKTDRPRCSDTSAYWRGLSPATSLSSPAALQNVCAASSRIYPLTRAFPGAGRPGSYPRAGY